MYYEMTLKRALLCIFDYKQGQAVIENGYKLLSSDDGDSWQLYDMSTDATELNDILTNQTSLFNSMKAKFDSWFLSVEDNILPTASDDSINGSFSGSLDIDVLANDSDSDGSINPETLVISTQPSFGNASVTEANTVYYIPGKVLQAQQF